MLSMTGDELVAFLRKTFPQGTIPFSIETLEDGFLRIRVTPKERYIRPGGTIAGPVLMSLADNAMYYLLLAMIGPVALALTTSLHINFLRAPKFADLIVDAKMLKLGKRLAVGDIRIYSDGSDDPVAHATVTYSIPPSPVDG